LNPLVVVKKILKVVFTIAEIDFELKKVRDDGKTIGFIPTMGALHQGHLNLVKRSVKECDFTIASIYVNPTQFNNPIDLEKYPRDIDQDSKMLLDVGCDLLFCPTDSVMYPNGFHTIKIDLDGLDSVLEGEFRPGHFDGVVTIVSRFFEIIRPNKSYFGEKDFQQLLVVRKIALNISKKIEIVPCKIEREKNGLALSSRNRRLSESDLAIAVKLNEVLYSLKKRVKKMPPELLEKVGKVELESLDGIYLEYLKIVDENSLKPDIKGVSSNLRAFVAAEIGGIRLIDNMRL